MTKEFYHPSESSFFKKNDGLLSSDPLFLRTQIKINASSESLLDEQGRLSCEGKQKTTEIFNNSQVDAAESLLSLKELGTEVSEKLSVIRKQTKKATEEEWKSFGAKLKPNREVIREQIGSKLKANEEWQKLKIQQKFAVSLSQKFKNKIKSVEAKKVEVVVSQNDLAAYKEKMGAWGTEARLRRSLVNFELKQRVIGNISSISDSDLERFKHELGAHDYDPARFQDKDLKEILALRKLSRTEVKVTAVNVSGKTFGFNRIRELLKDKIPSPLWEESRVLNLRQRLVLAGGALAAIISPIALNAPKNGESNQAQINHQEEIAYAAPSIDAKLVPDNGQYVNNLVKKSEAPAPKITLSPTPEVVSLEVTPTPVEIEKIKKEEEVKINEIVEVEQVKQVEVSPTPVEVATSPTKRPEVAPTNSPALSPLPVTENKVIAQTAPPKMPTAPPTPAPQTKETPAPIQKAPVLVLKTPAAVKTEAPTAIPTPKPVEQTSVSPTLKPAEKTPTPLTPAPVEKTLVPPTPTTAPTQEAPIAAVAVVQAAPVVEAPAPVQEATKAPESEHQVQAEAVFKKAPVVVEEHVEQANDPMCGKKYSSSNAPEGNFADPDCDFTIEGAKQVIRELDPQNASTWIEIMNRESSGRPNITARSVNGIAYGLMQMGKGLNGVYDNGRVGWRKQIENAIEYNRRLGNRAWQYWQAARDMGLWGKR